MRDQDDVANSGSGSCRQVRCLPPRRLRSIILRLLSIATVGLQACPEAVERVGAAFGRRATADVAAAIWNRRGRSRMRLR